MQLSLFALVFILGLGLGIAFILWQSSRQGVGEVWIVDSAADRRELELRLNRLAGEQCSPHTVLLGPAAEPSFVTCAQRSERS